MTRNEVGIYCMAIAKTLALFALYAAVWGAVSWGWWRFTAFSVQSLGWAPAIVMGLLSLGCLMLLWAAIRGILLSLHDHAMREVRRSRGDAEPTHDR